MGSRESCLVRCLVMTRSPFLVYMYMSRPLTDLKLVLRTPHVFHHHCVQVRLLSLLGSDDKVPISRSTPFSALVWGVSDGEVLSPCFLNFPPPPIPLLTLPLPHRLVADAYLPSCWRLISTSSFTSLLLVNHISPCLTSASIKMPSWFGTG
jgi:hypothetical protein